MNSAKAEVFSPYRLILREMLLYFTMVIMPFRCCSVVSNSETLSTVGHQDPLSMGFPRQEYYGGFPFPSPGGLPDLGIEPLSPALVGRFFTTEPPGVMPSYGFWSTIPPFLPSLAWLKKIFIDYYLLVLLYSVFFLRDYNTHSYMFTVISIYIFQKSQNMMVHFFV